MIKKIVSREWVKIENIFTRLGQIQPHLKRNICLQASEKPSQVPQS